MALKENLDSILTIKNNIKNALISLGISLTGKKFSDYSSIISSLDLEKHNVTTASKTITNNGTTTITPTNTNDVYNKVTVTTNVQPALEERTQTITSNGTTSITPNSGKDGISKVTTTVNVQPALQTKSVNATTSTVNVTADSSYYGLSKVTVNPIQTQTKSVNPTTTTQNVAPDSGKYLSGVSVGAIQTEEKTINPTTNTQTITPSSGKYISKVTVNPIQTQVNSLLVIKNGKTTITPNTGKYITKVTVDVNVEDYEDTRNIMYERGIISDKNITDYNMSGLISLLPAFAFLEESSVNGNPIYTLNLNKDFDSYAIFEDMSEYCSDLSSVFINNIKDKPIFAGGVGYKYNATLNPGKPMFTVKEIGTRNGELWVCNGYKMFWNYRNLTKLPVINLKDCYALQYMFYNCKNLKQINFKGRPYRDSSYYEAGMNAASNFAYMFAGCTNLEEIHGLDITNLYTNTTMWEGCQNLKKVTFDGTETIKGEVYLATYSRVMTNHDLYEALHSLPTPSTVTNLYVNKYTMINANGNYINGWNVKKVARFESDAAYYNWTVKYVYN